MAPSRPEACPPSGRPRSATLAIALAAALLAVAMTAQAENMLSNSGFERVDTEGMPVGWHTFTPTGQPAVTARIAHPGYNSRNCLLVESDEQLTIFDLHTAPIEMSKVGSSKMLFTCYYRTEQEPAAQMSLMTFAEDFYVNEWRTRPLQAEAKNIPTSNEWSLLSWQFEALPGGRQVVPLIRVTGTGKLYLDNLALRPYPAEVSATLTDAGTLQEPPDKRRTTVYLTNHTSQRRELQVVLIAVAEGSSAKRMQHTVQIKPNGTGMLHLDYTLPVNIPHSLQLVVRDADSGAVYEHTQSIATPLFTARFTKPAFRSTILPTLPLDSLEITGRINAVPHLARQFRLKAEIAETGVQLVEPSDQIQRPGPVNFTVTLPHTNLLSGDYTVLITASLPNDQFQQRVQLPLRRLVPSGSEVGYDHQQRLWVNGTPMLPRGLYYVCQHSDLAAIATAGFNFAVVPSTRASYAFGEEARNQKISLLISSPRLAEDSWQNLERKFGQNPALLGWCVTPRPDKQTMPPEVTANVCRQLRSISPSHLTLMSLASPSLLRYYSEFPDIIAAWSLPVPAAPITSVARMVDAAKEAASDWHPVWAIIQAAGPAWYNDQSLDPEGAGRAPTPAEVRAMTYLALVHGANGLMYYGYDIPAFTGTRAFKLPEDAPEIWTELAQINQQLGWLAPVILNGQRRLLTPAADGDVHLGAWHYQDGNYIVAVNTSNQGIVTEFTLPDIEASRLGVMFERRWISANDGVFNDSFAPHDVHIYSTR